MLVGGWKWVSMRINRFQIMILVGAIVLAAAPAALYGILWGSDGPGSVTFVSADQLVLTYKIFCVVVAFVAVLLIMMNGDKQQK